MYLSYNTPILRIIIMVPIKYMFLLFHKTRPINPGHLELFILYNERYA